MAKKSTLPFEPSSVKSNTVGKIVINARTVNNVSAIEIVPAGNGQYGLTVRIVVDKIPEVFRDDLKGRLTFAYQNIFLPTLHYTGTLMDIGIEDQDGVCVASFFFNVVPRSDEVSLIKNIK